MRLPERAAQLWPILALAGRNRQVLAYEIVSDLTGVPRQGLGQLLEPVQSFCIEQKLPLLTILVISEDTGLPGTGFVAAQAMPKTQMCVFGFNWLGHGTPSPEEFGEAVKKTPSNAVTLES